VKEFVDGLAMMLNFLNGVVCQLRKAGLKQQPPDD
jgi:hypothetical protein